MKSKILKFLTLAAAFCGMTAWGAIETQEAFVTACANAVSGDTLELGSGEFAIGPVDINGKTLTFKGQGAANTKVYIGNGGYDGNGGHGSSKTANMTFEDVTLDDLASNSGYLTGFNTVVPVGHTYFTGLTNDFPNLQPYNYNGEKTHGIIGFATCVGADGAVTGIPRSHAEADR